MKAMKKNDLGVSPVIAVILMVAITVVLAGVVFLWAQSFTDDASGGLDAMDISATVEIITAPDPDYVLISIDVNGGTIDWGNYDVKLGGTSVTANSNVTSAGDVQMYVVAAGTYAAGQTVELKIINIGDNKVTFKSDLRITSG